MSTFENVWQKLRSKEYREHFVDAQVKRAVPFQVRSLMKAQRLSQKELAAAAGLTQGVVSRAASPTYGNLTLNTIVRIAAGLDVAFIGRFVPFSELVRYYDELSEDMGDVPTFEEEDMKLSESDPTTSTAPAEQTASALREAAVTPQIRTTTAPWFRLTAPSVNSRPGMLVPFPPQRVRTARGSAASEAKAVSQCS